MADPVHAAAHEEKPPRPSRRSASTLDKTRRLVRLQDCLQRRPYSTAELARELEVGPRSIQRDLQVLRDMDIQIEQDREGHYYIPVRAQLPHAAEALAAYAALRLAHHHAPALANHYRRALDFLSRALPDHIRHTLNASVTERCMAQFAERQMETVALAWVERRVLTFDYQRPNGTLEPGHELCVYFIEVSRTNLAPYVIGLERKKHNKVRTFKLSRMHNLQLHRDTYEPDAAFDPKPFLSDAWGGIGRAHTTTVLVRFAPEAAYRVLEGGFPNTQVVKHGGCIDLEFTTGTSEEGFPVELMPFLLSWGPHAEVISPPQVRAHWLQQMRTALQKYDRDV